MKKIFRKNQLMITALALMLAVAGYFSFMDENLGDEKIAAEASADLLKEEYEISDEDMIVLDEIFVADEILDENEVVLMNDTADSEEVMNPGELMFTSSTVTVDYASEMKLSREQVRSKNKETLLEIINNTTVSDAMKQAVSAIFR